MPQFSIIIPNWNGQKFLKTCFDSFKKQSFKDFEVILVDNGSSDDSVTYTEKKYPDVIIEKLDHNSGFAGAVNAGIKKSKSDFVALLNNDTEVDKDWLKNIESAINKYPETSIFASKMLEFKNRQILDSCGDAATWPGRFYNIGRGEQNGPKYDENTFVFGACAGAAVYKKEIFSKIGYFDQDFFAYYEDVDFSFRAQLAGYKCLFVSDAKVYHIGSGTSQKISGFSFKLLIKNHFHVIYKNFPWQKILLNLHKIIFSEIYWKAIAIKKGLFKEYCWGVWHALIESPRMCHKRKKIQKMRKVDFAYLDSIIEPKFIYPFLTKKGK